MRILNACDALPNCGEITNAFFSDAWMQTRSLKNVFECSWPWLYEIECDGTIYVIENESGNSSMSAAPLVVVGSVGEVGWRSP